MKLLLLPTERSNKTVRKGKFFDQCVVCWPTVGRRVGGKLADASVVCQPTHRWCVGGVSTDELADASVGSDSLPLPISGLGVSESNGLPFFEIVSNFLEKGASHKRGRKMEESPFAV